MRRIGCFGINANPPHLGHKEAAEAFLNSGLVDEVWIIPTFNHPVSKADIVSWEHRVKMCQFLENTTQGIRISLAECELAEIEKYKDKKSYTVDTLEYLRRKFPDNSFSWCVGSDIVIDGSYAKWHNWEELEKEERILVAERTGYPLPDEKLPKPFVRVGRAYRDISSTDIRVLICEKIGFEEYTGKEIARYIRENNLYGHKGG